MCPRVRFHVVAIGWIAAAVAVGVIPYEITAATRGIRWAPWVHWLRALGIGFLIGHYIGTWATIRGFIRDEAKTQNHPAAAQGGRLASEQSAEVETRDQPADVPHA